ncbi:MAG: Gldg family protein [Terriglobia bacterium]
MKFLKNLASFGPALIIGGYLYYSIENIWSIPVQVIFYVGVALTLAMVFFNLGSIKDSFRLRSTQYGSNTVLVLLVVLGILGVINYLGKKHVKRFDLTTAKVFSLSDQSTKIVRNLKGEVKILYFDKEPNGALNDLMDEYKSISPGKIDFKTIDPWKEPAQAKQYGITRPKETVVAYGQKTEKVDSPQEEAVTNAILKVTREKNKVVYFLSGHNEGDISDGQDAKGFAVANKAIEAQNYQVKTLNLAEKPSLPEDCAVLVIAGPKVGLLPTESAVIDQYVTAGGKVLLMVDPDTNPGMAEELKKWKIALEDDIVVDASGIGQLFGMGPAAPLVTKYEPHPITKDLSRSMTFFPLARSVKIIENSGSSFNATLLLKTSENSWGETNLKSGSAEYNEGKDIKGPVALAAVSVGAAAGDEKTKNFGKEARAVVVGDSDFASNQYFNHQRNGDLFLNMISWLAEDEDLISVRPKNQENRAIVLTRAGASGLFWLAVVLLPGCALLGGIAVWRRRKK